MAEKFVKYKSLQQTLEGIRQQVIDSLHFCVNEMPSFNDPTEMFDSLRTMTTYKNDPPGIELLQTVPTLFDANYWGVPGAGDCDCFTILTLSMCLSQGWNDNQIVLVGRTPKNAVHIYSATIYKGKRYTLDLTNPYVNIERHYPYKQILQV
jgi:hypothetical protein